MTADKGARTIGFKLTNSSGGQMFRYGATTLQPNTWYHIAGVYNAAAQTLNVYLNGQLDNGVLQGTVTSSQRNSTANVNIGRRPGASGFEFIGRIDDVRIADHALTQDQIQTDMVTPLGPSGAGLNSANCVADGASGECDNRRHSNGFRKRVGQCRRRQRASFCWTAPISAPRTPRRLTAFPGARQQQPTARTACCKRGPLTFQAIPRPRPIGSRSLSTTRRPPAQSSSTVAPPRPTADRNAHALAADALSSVTQMRFSNTGRALFHG